MEFGRTLLSLIYFLTACTYSYWGGQVIKANKKERKNRYFLVICIAMSIWSFGFAMSNASNNLNAAIYWRRFSAIGWTSVYSLLVYFLLVLSINNLSNKQKNLLHIIHIPAIINMYIFAFSTRWVNIHYNLVKIDYGWNNVLINSGFDTFFRLYYISYLSLSILILWRWQRNLEDKRVAKNLRVFAYFVLATGTLGTITDLVLTSVLKKATPEFVPVFTLIPAGAMYFTVRYFDVFGAKTAPREEIIVTEKEQEKIFINLSLGFYVASIFTFISKYMPFRGEKDVFLVPFLNALIVLSIGITIRLIQNIKKEDTKRYLTTAVLIASVPICLSLFVKDANTTVWAFPMIMIISSTIFSKRILLYSITAVTIITQVLVWIINPQVTVAVNSYDFLLRLGMVIVAFFISLSTNKMYISKFKDNKIKIEFQKIVSNVLFDFQDVDEDNFNYKANNLLETIGVFFRVDRTYLYYINHDNQTIKYLNNWSKIESDKREGFIEKVQSSSFKWLTNELETKKILYIEDVDKMPKEASLEKENLRQRKVKSLVAVPVAIDDQVKAFIGTSSITEKKKWSQDNIEILNIMANILSNGMVQIRSDKKIEVMAYYDSLTNLPNRFLFEKRVNNAIISAEQNKKLAGIIFIDLDDFKSVNDTLGHDAGDYLLSEVSKRLSNKIRKTDTVSRFGGDEFIVLLNNVDNYEDITKAAENIMSVFSTPFTIQDEELFVSASGGVSVFPTDGECSNHLLKNADIAMYDAKAKGKNQYSLCTPFVKAEIHKSMKLSNDLFRALEKNELIVYYQPQISLLTKEIIGMEALLRWQHHEYGMISPRVFIPIAEKNGLINKIGRWVLKTACTQNKKWQEMGMAPVKVAVNLSGIQFTNKNIANDVETVLTESKLDPKYLELEITESMTIKETAFIINTLNKFKEIGVSVAIDDFGTEYSSLSRLKNLPIDTIKIDMAFIQGIDKDKKDEAITRVIINLAKSLGMNVLAEGVETELQLNFLKQHKCDSVQGYYYYKPMPAREAENILKDLKVL